MAKLLYVVHRYAPFPGGSEYYVRDMAEESLRRGHDVTVLAHTHQGDLNGVKVTNDYQRLAEKWDLIIVHGGDVISQNVVHINAEKIQSRVCYMLIKPSESDACMHGLKHHNIIAYSTSADIDFIKKHRVLGKSRRIRHGIVPEQTIRDKNKNRQYTYVSAGGFYPHKAMVPLAQAFMASKLPGELHLYGYGEGPMPQENDRVKVFFGKPKDDVMQAIANADAYIMNSYEEGFGLVLLEAMMNKTPWYARNIAGAKDMASYGNIYNDEKQLMEMLRQTNIGLVEEAYEFAMTNHTITQTVNDIEDIVFFST